MDRTRSSSPSAFEQSEFGAFIIEFGKKFWAPKRLTEGTAFDDSESGLYAKVDPNKMLEDLRNAVSPTLLRAIVVVGAAHSHPGGPGFVDGKDKDRDASLEMKRRQVFPPQWDFQTSYIWGPRWGPPRGFHDPVGQLYSFSP